MNPKGRILTLSGSMERENSKAPNSRCSDGDMFNEPHLKIRSEALRRTSTLLEPKRIPASELNSEKWKLKIEAAIKKSLAEIISENKEYATPDAQSLFTEIMREISGLGPVEDLINDPSISEIMINGRDSIYIEKNGQLIRTARNFSSDEMILAMIDRILAPLGKRIDISSPSVDARLNDGSRMHAIIPPLSLQGPVVTIRKFALTKLHIDDLIKLGTLSSDCADYLKMAVRNKKNIVVAGGTSSGKTTLLNVLAAEIHDGERTVVIEDSSELKLPQRHTIYLEARPPNIEGTGEVTIRDLVRNCLRMRPDRIIVGECRGGESIDMLQAMNTGHEGSMTTLHSNSPRDALSRLETMVLMSGVELPLRAIREQIASAIDVIVHLGRYSGGKRSITSIAEVCGTEDSTILTQELFRLRKRGLSKEPVIESTGNVPKREI